MSDQRYSYPNESFSGCDMVATMLVQKPNDTGKIVYSVGELQTISYSIHMDRKPIRSIGNINAKDYVMGPRTIAGSLVFAVFNKHFAKKIMDEMQDNVESDYAFLMDELPPIDIILSLANEYGLRSKIAIYGVRLVNEGQVMSVNDIYTENTYQFVATDIEYLTSDNNYTSSSKNGKNKYIIEKNGKTDVVDFYKLSLKNNKKANIETFSHTELSYQRKSKANKYSLGVINFTLSPQKTDGILYINGAKNLSIDLSTLNNTKVIQSSLPFGKYNAYWCSENNKSNEVNFSIEYEDIEEASKKPAPLIEGVTENSLYITSNVKEHTHIFYQNSDAEIYSLQLNGAKQATLKGLQPDSYYNIYTADSNNKNKSEVTKVKTLAFGFDLYADFIKFLTYNKKTLNEEDFSLYTEVVYKAKNYNYLNSNKYKNITATFYEVQNEYLNKIALLKKEDFENEYEYTEAFNRLTTLNNIVSEIISISNKIINDKLYGFNKEFMVVQPPQLEVEDFSTQNLIIENNIEKLVFFRKTNSNEHYYKTIYKKNFSPYYNDKMVCNFIGRAKEKYYVYAENINGYRSPRVDLYILSDEEKEKKIIKATEENKDFEYNATVLSNQIDLLNNINDEDSKNLLILEKVKSIGKVVLNDISIEKIDDFNFRVKINNGIELLKNNEAKITISTIKTIAKNSIKFKKEISDYIIFNISDAGVKDEKYFACWLEDGYENQISNCVVFNIESSYTEVDKYVINSEIQKVETYMYNNGHNSLLLSSILSSLSNDEDVIRSNILNEILENIIINIDNFNNNFKLLTCFLEYYFNKYTILSDLFYNDIIYNKSRNSLYIEDQNDIIAVIYNTSSQIDIEYSEVINSQIVLDSSYRYNIINFIKKDLSYRSGFFIVDNKAQKTYSYILPIKVGE